MILLDPIDIISTVINVLERLHIAYYIGGSFASSLYGIPRTSQDIDIITDIKEIDVRSFVQNLEGEFYIDESMIRNAIARKTSFNIIHFTSSYKIDVFISKGTVYAKEEMFRRILHTLRKEPLLEAYFARSEDIILEKLLWFTLSNKTLETQWKDVLGIIKVQSGALDIDYLKHWSDVLGISNLLEMAIQATKS